MLIVSLLIIPFVYIVIKLTLFLVVKKYGKFSYDGFSAAGFAYNSKKDIFYSTKNAWQKKFGYCHLYDVGAPIFRMIIDTEPVKFYHNDKNWLITFWKGQYGIVTGAEIGIYSTKDKKVNKRTMYLPVCNDEMLDMDFTLYRKGKKITKVKSKHWWLAIFKIGMFSKPKDLTMDINMKFPNKDMLKSFLISFKKLGYKESDYEVINNIFHFIFKKPRTHKVWTRSFILDHIRQHFNRKNVELYNKYLADVIETDGYDDSKINDKKIIRISKMIPSILKNSINEDMNLKTISKKDNEESLEDKLSRNILFLNDSVYSDLKKDKS